MQAMNQKNSAILTVIMRSIWLVITLTVLGMVLTAAPLRFQMLQIDVYGYAEGLDALGLSLTFFAAYFTFWELIVVGGSILVGALIAWKKGNDWFAMLVAIALTLFGLLPPLVDGLSFTYPQWTLFIVMLRVTTFSCLLAVFCLFPNGRFAPKWTAWLFVFWLLFLGITLLVKPSVFADTAILPNTRTAQDALFVFLGAAWYGTAIFGQIIRYRRYNSASEKQQAKWVLLGFSIVVVFSLITSLLLISLPQLSSAPGNRALFGLVMGGIYLLTALALPGAISLSILRFRLWDVDIYINRTLVYGGLTAVIILFYALVVGGLSLLLQSQNSFLFSLLATGLIAILFQPVREWLQRATNRLMFGERNDPYKVLSQLGRQLQDTAVPEQSLPVIVATITQSLKLPYAAIALASNAGLRQMAAQSGKKADVTEEWPLLYQGEIVGWLLATPRSPGETFTQKERQLLEDIALQAGAVAYSVRLMRALQHSREQLVFAREEERLRIRRDLHDELGPSLASQTFKLDQALDLLATNPQESADLLNSLKKQNQNLVSEIRRLVYELRPPALDELGLIGAVDAHIGQFNPPAITLRASPTPFPSVPAALEVAVYRIILEAVTNVVRHAQATQCQISLRLERHKLQFLRIEVEDDGVGMPTFPLLGLGIASMRERAEELGGSFHIGRHADGGVRLTAQIPVIEGVIENNAG